MNKEELSRIVKESETLTEVLDKMGLRSAGGNYKTLKKYLGLYGIDVSHFDSEKVRFEKIRDYFRKTKKPMVEILVENSSFSRGTLKLRLYEEGIKKKACELCGQNELWMGKKMSLILDHINGVHNDNRLENLRVVCPNCNATLDTHCGKHRSMRSMKLKALGLKEDIDFRRLPTEGKRLSGIKRRKVERPPVEEVLEQVKKNGFLATGRKYGVSDNAIRK